MHPGRSRFSIIDACVLGITNMQQRLGHISSVQVAKWLGMEESLKELNDCGKETMVARMSDDRIPKSFCLDG